MRYRGLAMKIIVVEDNVDLLQEMMFMLQHYGHSVRGATCGEDLDRQIADARPDMVVLDVGLPGEDGFAIAECLHRLQPAPGVVMLTARASVEDRVQGLRFGADHYLVKPVDRRELLAVLDRVHLRVRGGDARAVVEADPVASVRDDANAREQRDTARPAAAALSWALDGAQLRIASPLGETVELSAREHQLLLALVRAGGRPVARSVLLKALGRGDGEADERALEVKVSRLRKKLRDINAGEAPLRAEWGAGYVFAERCRVITR